MNTSESILRLLYDAIDEINRQLPEDQHIEKSRESILFGKGSRLDSLGLVNLIVETETRLADELGATITIADERAMSQKHSPFKSVGALADYIGLLLTEDPK